MTWSTCRGCGKRFWREPGETWKVRCVTCWRASKNVGAIELSLARERIAMLEAEIQFLRERKGIPAEMLSRLIRLCHPDRHGGNDASTVATQWLLGLRKTDARHG